MLELISRKLDLADEEAEDQVGRIITHLQQIVSGHATRDSNADALLDASRAQLCAEYRDREGKSIPSELDPI